jgi:hypothetical protein
MILLTHQRKWLSQIWAAKQITEIFGIIFLIEFREFHREKNMKTLPI